MRNYIINYGYYIINCWDYEISNGREFSQSGFFIKTKLYKLKETNY